MADIERDHVSVERHWKCLAEHAEIIIELGLTYNPRYPEVNKRTPWLGKIFDPPNPEAVRKGGTYTITRSDGRSAKCKLLLIADYIPGADVHYVPDVAPRKVWVFLGLKPF